MRRIMFVAGLLLSVSFSVAAQDFSRAEIFGGYTYARVYNSNGDTSSSNGGSADVAFYPTRMLGLVADFGGAVSNGYTNSSGTHVDTSSDTIHYFFGPRLRFGTGRITPYVQVLAGGIHRSNVVSDGTILVNAETSFALAAGGGVDVRVANHFAIRAIQIDYVYTRFSPNSTTQNTQNDVSITTGIVFRW